MSLESEKARIAYIASKYSDEPNTTEEKLNKFQLAKNMFKNFDSSDAKAAEITLATITMLLKQSNQTTLDLVQVATKSPELTAEEAEKIYTTRLQIN